MRCSHTPTALIATRQLSGDNSPEVVGDETQRLAVGLGPAGSVKCGVEQCADRGGADCAVLGADPALEQDRQGRVEDPLVVVVGGHQRDRPLVVTDPADDRAEHVSEFGADDQQCDVVRTTVT
jgi:hypothetical protein